MSENSSPQPTAWEWVRDPARGCWDGTAPDGRTGCVAKDGRGSKPWGAWFDKGGGAGTPDSWHATMHEARRACEDGLPA